MTRPTDIPGRLDRWPVRLAAACLLALVLAQFWPLGPRPPVLDSTGPKPRVVGVLDKSAQVRQRFVCPADNLTGLEIQWATFKKINRFTARWRLIDVSAKEVVRRGRLDAATVPDWGFSRWTFAPLADSAGRLYELLIDDSDDTAGYALAVLATDKPVGPVQETGLWLNDKQTAGSLPLKARTASPLATWLIWVALLAGLAAVIRPPSLKTAFLVLPACFLVIKLTAFVPVKPWFCYDAGTFLGISLKPLLSPDFWGSRMPPGLPFLYKTIGQFSQPTGGYPANLSLLTWAQFVIAVLAWTGLGLVTAGLVRLRPLKPAALALILALGLAGDVAGFDRVLMSESLSASTLAAWLAAWLWLLKKWGWGRFALFILCAVLFAAARDTNAWLLLMLAGGVILAAAVRFLQPRHLLAAAVMLLCFLGSTYSAETNGDRWMFPFFNVLMNRMSLDQDRWAYFTGQGLPLAQRFRAEYGQLDSASSRDNALFKSPDWQPLRDWARAEGKRAYVKFLLTRPGYLLGAPFDPALRNWLAAYHDWAPVDIFFSPPLAQADYLPPEATPPVGRVFEAVFYPKNRWVLFGLTGLGLAGLLAAMVLNRRRPPPESLAAVGLALTVLPLGLIVWHGDAQAVVRHFHQVGLQLRLAMWLILVFAVDGWIGVWRGRGEGGE